MTIPNTGKIQTACIFVNTLVLAEILAVVKTCAGSGFKKVTYRDFVASCLECMSRAGT